MQKQKRASHCLGDIFVRSLVQLAPRMSQSIKKTNNNNKRKNNNEILAQTKISVFVQETDGFPQCSGGLNCVGQIDGQKHWRRHSRMQFRGVCMSFCAVLNVTNVAACVQLAGYLTLTIYSAIIRRPMSHFFSFSCFNPRFGRLCG